MTLVQMRYFYEVCQWQNITKAAEHLHVSQPTVTVAMQALEAETGLNLFHREGRKITVTTDGAKLLGKISSILMEITRLDNEIRDMAHRHAKVRIAMPLQLGVVFLPHILGEFRRAHPEIELEIIETGGVSALQMVEEEKLDLALTNYTADFSARLSYSKLFDCECTFVTRPDHPFAQRHSLSIAELQEEPLVMLDSGFFVNRLVQDAYGRIGEKPNVVHYSPYLHTVKNLVSAGIGSTFLARPSVLPGDHLVQIPLIAPMFINSGLVTKKGRQTFDDVRLVMSYLRRLTKELLGGGK
mgnify:FL=1